MQEVEGSGDDNLAQDEEQGGEEVTEGDEGEDSSDGAGEEGGEEESRDKSINESISKLC